MQFFTLTIIDIASIESLTFSLCSDATNPAILEAWLLFLSSSNVYPDGARDKLLASSLQILLDRQNLFLETGGIYSSVDFAAIWMLMCKFPQLQSSKDDYSSDGMNIRIPKRLFVKTIDISPTLAVLSFAGKFLLLG